VTRRSLVLLLRFALIYGALVAACVWLPIYAQVERAAVPIANGLLRSSQSVTRQLAFVSRDGVSSYSYELRAGGQGRRGEYPLHQHGFVLALFLALVLATPGLGARGLALGVFAGGGLAFLLCVLLLMADAAGWDAEASGALGLAPSQPYFIPLGFVAGLHRTAAAGMLPIALWVLFALPRAARPARKSPATSRA
jgi:hypothetical protein